MTSSETLFETIGLANIYVHFYHMLSSVFINIVISPCGQCCYWHPTKKMEAMRLSSSRFKNQYLAESWFEPKSIWMPILKWPEETRHRAYSEDNVVWRSRWEQKIILLLLKFSTREFQLSGRVVFLGFQTKVISPLSPQSTEAFFLSSNGKTKPGRDWPQRWKEGDSPCIFSKARHSWGDLTCGGPFQSPFPAAALGSLRTWSPVESTERLLTTLLQLPYGHEWRRQQNHSEPGEGQPLTTHLCGEAGGRGGGKGKKRQENRAENVNYNPINQTHTSSAFFF